MVAYHALTRSLEAATHVQLSARGMFAASVGHVLHGFVPTDRHHHAGRLAVATRQSESAMSTIVTDQLCIDLNPFVRCMVHASTRHGALLVHQKLNQLADLAIRTEVGFDASGLLTVGIRTASPSGEDPAVCRDVHLMGMDIILSGIVELGTQTNADNDIYAGGNTRLKSPDRISGLAAFLGLGSSLASDAALVFETDAEINVQDLSQHLGCHSRTLQREFKAYGLTAETIKRACMLTRATALLSTTMTLTSIAHEAGYADHAHMTRAFVRSCAVPPSILRQAFTLPLKSTQQLHQSRADQIYQYSATQVQCGGDS